jgi:hypothetical protein
VDYVSELEHDAHDMVTTLVISHSHMEGCQQQTCGLWQCTSEFHVCGRHPRARTHMHAHTHTHTHTHAMRACAGCPRMSMCMRAHTAHDYSAGEEQYAQDSTKAIEPLCLE